MPEEVDLRELTRRFDQLERTVERISGQATARQDEFGSVRVKTEKVDELLERVRTLEREVQRLSGRKPEATPVPVPQAFDLKGAVSSVLGQLRDQHLPTREEVVELIRQEITNATSKVDLQGLADRVYKDLTTAGVEEKLAKLLQGRVAGEVDARAIVSVMAEQVLKQLDLNATVEKLVAKLVEQLEVSITPKRRYS